jgi:7,8-dihydropterin-6-yl-methyl-4-(beta-D-ribofuranosyl)aminobenzene 5'-phosphate synthase
MTSHRYNNHIGATRREIVTAGLTAPFWLPGLARSVMAKDHSSEQSGLCKGELTATILYDNYPGPKELNAQWGFSCVIRGPEKTILFDTGGDGAVLLGNMRQLKVDPKEIDVVVLSHIHWDHTGGVPSIAAEKAGLPVYIPSGFPEAFHAQAKSIGTRTIEAAESVEICPGVQTTGTLGRGAIEEHGLCVKTDDGWAMVTGCAHPGVEKMAAEAKRVTGGPLRLVLGGFHLGADSTSRTDAIIDRLEKLDVRQVAPTHCTENVIRTQFKKRYGDRCELAHLGSVFRFGPSNKAAESGT